MSQQPWLWPHKGSGMEGREGGTVGKFFMTDYGPRESDGMLER